MGFETLLGRAKAGDRRAKAELYQMYRPDLLHKAMIFGGFDEDLYQELCIKLLVCIDRFDMDRIEREED